MTNYAPRLCRLTVVLSILALSAACGTQSGQTDRVDSTNNNDDVAVSLNTTELVADPPESADDSGGAVTEQQAAEGRRGSARADVAVAATLVEGLLTIEVNALDVTRLIAPQADVTLFGLTHGDLPDDCMGTEAGFTCRLAASLGSPDSQPPPTESVRWSVIVRPIVGEPDASISVVATSSDNPVDNDPDPTNNNVTITTAE